MTLSVLDAAYHTVHEYPGGAEALGSRLSPPKSGTTLSHEVRPPAGNAAKLGVMTAVQIVALTGDHRIAYAFCAQAGGMFVPLVSHENSPASVLSSVSGLAKEFGDVVAAITSSAADGGITLNELRRIEREAVELMSALQSAMRAARELHEGH